jgi:hypothetical protein
MDHQQSPIPPSLFVKLNLVASFSEIVLAHR